jgi:hypothetical protein
MKQISLELIAMALLSGDLSTPKELLPDMDCGTCLYKRLTPYQGHCYMFSTAPDYHNKCAQYRRD